MKPETTEDILELMNGYIASAALGTAMELGVFWLLAEKPLSTTRVAQCLNIQLNRCHNWLQILCKLGLLEESTEGYAPSIIAREAILNVQSQDTWAFQAREDRDSSLLVQNLALNITKPISGWETWKLTPPDYFQQIQEDPSYAARFTRKLYEIHCLLADQLAEMLDLRGVKSLLDLGGGSGVVSFALLRKQPDMTSVVVDVESVCQAGREIASENKLERRIKYLAADFLQDDLPTGFNMVMLCDVGVFSENLFRRIYKVLNPKGRLVIVDKFAPSRTNAPPSRLFSAFLYSLVNPAQSVDFATADVVQTRLQRAGFRDFSITSVPHRNNLPWNMDWIMLEARKHRNMV
ncbi:MAG: methyltransferase [Anaerolineales bacterium]|nr:MAG: methyltransferase [Anaerolineales bacterium]